MADALLTADAVKAGDALPELAVDVSATTVVLGALAKALPDRIPAASQGTMNNLTFGNDRHQYYETICGGTGAGDTFDGADAVHSHMTNSRITDPEVLEWRFPVLVEDFRVREGSGGSGRWRGGDSPSPGCIAIRCSAMPCRDCSTPARATVRSCSGRSRWRRRCGRPCSSSIRCSLCRCWRAS